MQVDRMEWLFVFFWEQNTMGIHPHSYLSAAFPPPLRAPQPRCFYLTWDNSKRKTPNQAKYHKLEAIGCQFPNGVVALDNQTGYNSLAELERTLGEYGTVEVIWLDEREEPAQPEKGYAS
jgi:hypothetical protein